MMRALMHPFLQLRRHLVGAYRTGKQEREFCGATSRR